MIEKAVIDQFVDGKKVVLLVGDKEELWTITIDQLPVKAKEGDWVMVEIQGEQLTVLTVEQKTTEEATHRIGAKMEQLRLRRGSNYDK